MSLVKMHLCNASIAGLDNYLPDNFNPCKIDHFSSFEGITTIRCEIIIIVYPGCGIYKSFWKKVYIHVLISSTRSNHANCMKFNLRLFRYTWVIRVAEENNFYIISLETRMYMLEVLFVLYTWASYIIFYKYSTKSWKLHQAKDKCLST